MSVSVVDISMMPICPVDGMKHCFWKYALWPVKNGRLIHVDPCTVVLRGASEALIVEEASPVLRTILRKEVNPQRLTGPTLSAEGAPKRLVSHKDVFGNLILRLLGIGRLKEYSILSHMIVFIILNVWVSY
jgi:hypothetical protein